MLISATVKSYNARLHVKSSHFEFSVLEHLDKDKSLKSILDCLNDDYDYLGYTSHNGTPLLIFKQK